MKDLNLKSLVPHIVAIIVFVILTLGYFSPIMEGYEIRQPDIVNYKGMAKEIQDFRNETGEEALWTNSMFGGMPGYQIDVRDNTSLIRYISLGLYLGFPGVVGYFFVLFLGFYVLMLCLRVNPWLAMVGAIAYAFSTYFILVAEAGHNTKVLASAYFPAALGGFILTLRENKWWGAAVFSLFLALEIMSNHLQITYYLFLMMLAIGIGELVIHIRKGTIKDLLGRSVILVGGALIAVLANITLLVNTYDYGKDTTRGPSELTISPEGAQKDAEQGLDIDYMTRWSYGKDETFNLLIPSAKGGGSSSMIKSAADFQKIKDPELRNFVSEVYGRGAYINNYWGEQPGTGGPTYIGALIIFLFVLAMVLLKDPLKWPVLIISILAIMLSWGHNFLGLTQFFYDHVPGYNKFRSVTMILTIVQLAFPMLAILLVKQWIEDRDYFIGIKKKFLLASGIFGGVMVLMMLSPDLFVSMKSNAEGDMFGRIAQMDPSFNAAWANGEDALLDYRRGVFRADAFRSFLFVAGGFLLLFLFLNQKIKSNLLIGGLALLVTIDLVGVDLRFLNNEKESGQYKSWQKSGEAPFYSTASDAFILNQEVASNPQLLKELQTGLSQDPSAQRDQKKMDEIAFPILRKNSHYRVLLGVDSRGQDAFNSSEASYFHRSVGGYHGAKLKKYQELIEFHLSREVAMVNGLIGQLKEKQVPVEQWQLAMSTTGIFDTIPVLNMLNTKYLVDQAGSTPVINPGALGAAWFIQNVQYVPSANEEVLGVGKIDPARTAIAVEKNKAVLGEGPFSVDSLDKVELVFSSPKQLNYKYSSQKGGVIVFSEIFYDKGWKASLDGQEIPIARVNYVLRALKVPAGKDKQIEFVFEPDTFYSYQKINLAGNLLLLVLVGLFTWLGWKKK